MTRFATEAEMVEVWLGRLRASRQAEKWTIYPETGGWDILLAHEDGRQVGIEAKLALNPKVVAQALDGSGSYWSPNGPDYRAVLVPSEKCQNHLGPICRAIGLSIIEVRSADAYFYVDLPTSWGGENWPNWCPAERVKLPDYIPDVSAGHSAPVMLTDWKIRAIKLLLILDRKGSVTRKDMKELGISPTRWTDAWHGFLERTPEGFVRCSRTPDLKAQHPVNWAQIEADIDKWWTFR
jgi:hypothetical protein